MFKSQILRAAVFAASLGVFWTVSQAQAAEPVRSEQGDERLHIQLVDLSPKFLDFWAAAKDVSDPAGRYALWKEKYGFAAVPPGPQGEEIARKLLLSAWDKYPAAMETIRAGAPAMRPDALSTLRKVAEVLRPDQPMTVKVVTYVGAFDGNAFSLAQDGMSVVAIPLEMSADQRARIFPHEMTHAVHMAIAHLSGGWERTIGTTAFQEGLAVEVAREVNGGGDVRPFIEFSPGWYDKASARRRAILEGVLPYLDNRDGQTVFRFTVGQGSSGLEREAYFVGFQVMERLHAKGMSWSEIARLPEDKMPSVVRTAIQEMLAEAR
jgi:hypothetical protein